MKKLLLLLLLFTGCSVKYVSTLQPKIVTGFYKDGLLKAKKSGKPIAMDIKVGDTVYSIGKKRIKWNTFYDILKSLITNGYLLGKKLTAKSI